MGILTAGEILVLLLLHALIRGFQITGSHLFPPLPLAIMGLFLFFLLYFSLYFCNFAALFYLTTENKDPYNEKDIYSNGFCALLDDACRG